MPLLRLIAVIPCRDKLPRTTAFFSQLNIRKTTRQPPRPSCDLAFLILFTLSNNNLSIQERVPKSTPGDRPIVPHSLDRNGGADRDRTGDLKLAKLALSQLSYGPVSSGRNTVGVAAVSGSGGPGKI